MKKLTLLISLSLLFFFESCIILEFTAPSIADAGSEIDVSCKVKNNLASRVSGGVIYYLSYDRFLNSSDIQLKYQTYPELQAGETAAINTSLVIPPDLISGKYYLIASTLTSNFIREIQITGAEASGKDLVPINVLWLGDLPQDLMTTKRITSGANINFYFSIFNRGSLTATNVNATYYISNNASLDAQDTEIGGHSPVTISNYSEKELEGTFTIDNSILPGEKYLLIKVDAENTVDEFDESNNVIAMRINVLSSFINNDHLTERFSQPKAAVLHSILSKDLKLYPNPTQGLFTFSVELPETVDVAVSIFDPTGKLVQSFSKQKQSGMFSEQIDMSTFSNGMYIVKIRINDEVMTRKIVVQH